MAPIRIRGVADATIIPEVSVKKPIKLYFALLNKGWLRREFVAHQLPGMKKTPGVELLWEEPSMTIGHPIYSNRNKIVKRFLQSDCDFLMMQDDDILPFHNPAELVYADKDIIGCPAKVRTEHGTLDWVAYVWHEDLGGYVTVSLSQASADVDLLRVDVVGTGLILIRRNVLESIKSPFTVENDEDGVCSYGTDFAFCKRARAAGFEVFTTPHRICEHIKEVGLLDIGGYDDSDYIDTSNHPYKIPWGGWAIQMKDWKFIREAMEEYGVQKVLEFGSGLSSLLMSEGHSVRSHETNPKWAADIRAKMNGNRLEVVDWDGKSDVSEATQPDGYDMAFIDGPPGLLNGGPGRARAYELAAKANPPIIITHDSGRREEQAWANRYLRGKYEKVSKNGHHQQRCELWKRLEI